MISLVGIVVHGEKRGRMLGYPTANIEFKKKAHVQPGIYAGHVQLDTGNYNAAIYVPESLDRAEAHILEYEGESLYGIEVEFFLIQKVSEIEKYDTDGELIQKIKRDVEMVKEVLST